MSLQSVVQFKAYKLISNFIINIYFEFYLKNEITVSNSCCT